MSAGNETEKLTATWLNTLSAAVVVAGVIAPLTALKEPLEKGEVGFTYIGSSLLWFVAGYVTHVFGRIWLERRYKE